MILRLLFTTVCSALTTLMLSQGISGTVSDSDGKFLPYVSIYVEGTTTGTTTNQDGQYLLPLSPGNYTINFQFIGFETRSLRIQIEQETIVTNVTLAPQAIMLNEVVIAADREDPAYEIIRNAIRKRKYYKDLSTNYSCEVYVKGNQKILKIPERIMGFEIGDLEGMLDSNRQGIVYLSESVSTLHVKGDQHKEIVTSSKLSGNAQGYSFNSAKEMEFDFYDNTIEFQRQMVSPIANNALSYYRYKLLGVFIDQQGRLINQIEVLPKRENDPVFYGTIFIVDGLWNIHSLDLSVTPEAAQVFFIDTLRFNQVFVPVATPDRWALFSNTISFRAGMLGVDLKGIFTGVYRDYNFDPSFEENFFDANIHVVTKESNERDSIYWTDVRPVPLTLEEVKDYHKKDSIYDVRNDPIYMDSVDRESSAFKIGNVLSGYNYVRRSKRYYFDISSPLGQINFNTVQGYNVEMNIDGRKYFDEGETRRILFGGKVNYGFSEKILRANGYFVYRPSRLNIHEIRIEGGSNIDQYNSSEPITPFLNTVYSLLYRKNHAKYIGLQYAKVNYRFEPLNGFFVNASINLENRIPLRNQTSHSFKGDGDITYQTNNPLNPQSTDSFFKEHQAFYIEVRGSLFFKQKYFVYPDRKFFAGNEGPIFRFNYKRAFNVGGADISYQKLAVSLEDEWNLGVAGRTNWYLNGGLFFSQDRIEFRDFRHFLGNQIFFMKNMDYSNKFLLLPYYSFSTADHYFQLHLQHYFDGFLLDKLPLFQKMSWSLVTGMKFLKSGNLPSYWEFHVGLNNLGYRIVRLARLDAVVGLHQGNTEFGLRLSLGFN